MGRLYHIGSFLMILSSFTAAFAQPADAPAPARPGKQLAPIPPVGRWMSVVACITSGLRYHQFNTSDATIYGGTGFAFALCIANNVNISGPTSWSYQPCFKLAANLGLNITDAGIETKAGRAKDVEETWQRIAAGIDQNTPAFAWALDVPEYYVIFGYDAQGNYLFRDFGGGVKKLPHGKLCEGWPLWAYTMSKGKPADETRMVKDALQFALESAAGKYTPAADRAGIAAYDRWIKSTAAGDSEPEGYAYNAQCWSECRQAATAFLREVAQKETDKDLKALYEEAAQAYGAVATELQAVANLFPFPPGNVALMRKNYADKARREQAIKHLEAARDAETQGLAILEQIVAK